RQGGALRAARPGACAAERGSRPGPRRAVGLEAQLEALAWGYGLVEGPCAAPDCSVYFSDVLGGGVHRWLPDATIETVLAKRRGIGGIALHAAGGLVLSGRDVIAVGDQGPRK